MLKIVLPYDPVWRALGWAKKHCPSYITNKATTEGNIVYYFGSEKEAIHFSLRWQ